MLTVANLKAAAEARSAEQLAQLAPTSRAADYSANISGVRYSPLSALKAFTAAREGRMWATQGGSYCLMRCDANPYDVQARASGDIGSVCFFPAARSLPADYWMRQRGSMVLPGGPLSCNGQAVLSGASDVNLEQQAALVAWAHSVGQSEAVANTDRLPRMLSEAQRVEHAIYHNEISEDVTTIMVGASLAHGGRPTDYALFLQECALASPETGVNSGLAKLEQMLLVGEQSPSVVRAELEKHVFAVDVDGRRATEEFCDESAQALAYPEQGFGPVNTIEYAQARNAFEVAITTTFADFAAKHAELLDASMTKGFPLKVFQEDLEANLRANGAVIKSGAGFDSMMRSAGFRLTAFNTAIQSAIAAPGKGSACALFESTQTPRPSDIVNLSGKVFREAVLTKAGLLSVLREHVKTSDLGLRSSQAVTERSARDAERANSLKGDAPQGITRA